MNISALSSVNFNGRNTYDEMCEEMCNKGLGQVFGRPKEVSINDFQATIMGNPDLYKILTTKNSNPVQTFQPLETRRKGFISSIISGIGRIFRHK